MIYDNKYFENLKKVTKLAKSINMNEKTINDLSKDYEYINEHCNTYNIKIVYLNNRHEQLYSINPKERHTACNIASYILKDINEEILKLKTGNSFLEKKHSELLMELNLKEEG